MSGSPNGQYKLVTYEMEMPVLHCFYLQIKKKQLDGRLKEVITVLGEYMDVEIVEGKICPNHVY